MLDLLILFSKVLSLDFYDFKTLYSRQIGIEGRGNKPWARLKFPVAQQGQQKMTNGFECDEQFKLFK